MTVSGFKKPLDLLGETAGILRCNNRLVPQPNQKI
eukprot:COSAG04_NODE_25843_length_302_cov_1.266010_1_plen_34_part_10